MNLTYTLLADGSSDKVLMPIINWVLEQIPNTRLTAQFAAITPPPSKGLLCRAKAAIDTYECDILLVHRDAENASIVERSNEIKKNLRKLNKTYVPIVPIRMSEAWLLIDENAIRSAASNPNGSSILKLPKIERLEKIKDPKAILFEQLILASELSSARLKKFSPESRRHRVSELITDFSPLRKLSAFQQFEDELKASVNQLIKAL